VSDDPTSWFHCARCGTLFRAPLGRAPVCAACGENPSLGVAAAPEDPPLPKFTAATPQPLASDAHAAAHRRKKQSGAPMPFIIAAWTGLMLLVLFASHRYMKNSELSQGEWKPPERLTARENQLLEKHAGDCRMIFLSALSSQTPEDLAPLVFNRIGTLPDMVRFYRLNPVPPMEETEVEKTLFSVIRLPEGPAIEARWTLEDGRVFDLVFRSEDDEWRVDWHHFVRYSEHPWPMFLAGNGPDVAEFRLLVRRRLALRVLEEDDPDSPLEFVFHTPRFGRPDAPGPASPTFVLARDSHHARLLMAGFEQARDGRFPFRSILPAVEPDDEMMRIRVVIRRSENPEVNDDGPYSFEILEIKALHWLAHDDLGLAPP